MSPSTDVRDSREFASEFKFLITPGIAEQIRQWARGRLASDPNGLGKPGDAYQITSLYFATDQFDVFHRRGSFGRSKYRLRRYGLSETAFLERKLKTRGLLTKRRSIVQLEELERLADDEAARGWAGRWFHRRLQARRLRIVVQISYRRAARVAMTNNGPIRLTLDDDVRALPAEGMAFNHINEGIRLLENQVILELKFLRHMPVLFKLLVEEFALNPRSVSKYRLAAAALDLVPTPSLQTNYTASSSDRAADLVSQFSLGASRPSPAGWLAAHEANDRQRAAPRP